MSTCYNQGNTSIAIVGCGPRGLSVFERLAVYMQNFQHSNVTIYLIDDYQIGCGRIWRTDQPAYFLMNTLANEISAFSGPLDADGARPGAGPSFDQWWKNIDPKYPGPNSYAPRKLYGQYMQFVLKTIESKLRNRVKLVKINDCVVSLIQNNSNIKLYFKKRSSICIHQVVLTTGHAIPTLRDNGSVLSNFALAHKNLKYIQGDSAADMPLEKVHAGERVGILGLGLSFYDVLSSFTIGRGGHFISINTNELKYIPSGKEPLLFAGSRSGVPILSRGKNQKDGNYKYKPVFFTIDWAKKLRQKGKLDFLDDILPVLLAEANFIYYATTIRLQKGTNKEIQFRQAIQQLKINQINLINDIALSYGVTNLSPINLEALSQPFSGKKFASQELFEEELLNILTKDILHAKKGNINSPLKAALDTIKDTRSILKILIDYGGLKPESHKKDFLNWYVPRSNFLTAGPPLLRTKQLIALIKSGILNIVGPQICIKKDIKAKRFQINSLQIDNSFIHVDTIIDARIPTTDINADTSSLTKSLIQKGIWKNYVNKSESNLFITGGVAITQAPFHPIGKDNTVNKNIYVLGIPSEHTRWFMQDGSGKPEYWTDFVKNADSIANSILNYIIENDNHSNNKTQQVLENLSTIHN